MAEKAVLWCLHTSIKNVLATSQNFLAFKLLIIFSYKRCLLKHMGKSKRQENLLMKILIIWTTCETQSMYTCMRMTSDLRMRFLASNWFLWQCSHASDCVLSHPTADLQLRNFSVGEPKNCIQMEICVELIVKIGYMDTYDIVGRLHLYITLLI